MKKFANRITAFLLALILVLTCLPNTVFASSTGTTATYTVNHYVEYGNNPGSYYISNTESKTGTIGSTITLKNLAKNYIGSTYKEGKVSGSVVTTINLTANMVIDLYYTRNTVTVTLNKGTGISSVSGAGTYRTGTTINISASVSNGYTWSGWTVDSGYLPSVPATASASLYIYEETVLTANATAPTADYTVNHYLEKVAGGYYLTSTETKTGDTGATITLANLKKTFTGFYYDYGTAQSKIVTTTTVLADGSRVINLYYTRNSYTVTITKGTGISTVSGAGTYKYGETVSIGATLSSGYTWAGWTVNSGDITAPTAQMDAFIMPNSNVVLTANAASNAVTYTVYHYIENLNNSYYAIHSTESKTGPAGETLTLANLKKTIPGFTYSHGTAGGSATTTTTILADGSRSIYLYYTRNTYAVTLNKGTGIASVSGAGTYKYGATVPISATLSTGYYFSSWTVNSGGITAPTGQSDSFTMPDNDVALTANGSRTTYTITYNLDGGALPSGTFNPPAYTVDTATFTLNNPTKEGYTFIGWTGSNGTTAQTTVTIAKGSTGNRSYTANWTIDPVKYTVNHYTEDLTSGMYTKYGSTESKSGIPGTTLTLSDLAKTISGFTYSHGIAGGSRVTTTTILADGSLEINLYYSRNSYAVSVMKGTGISAVSGAGTYKYGATVSIGATVSSGYTWNGWTVNSGGITTPDTRTDSFTMPAKAVTLTANATANTYTITYNLDGGSVATANPTSYTVETETFTLVNPTKEGYTFAGWTGSNGTTPQTTVTITKGSTGNRSYTANWTTSTVKYTVEHWQEKIGVDGTDYANNYTKITTETLYTNAGALVKPTVNTYEGFTSPAPQEATVEADGNTVVKYYYARNRYVLSIGKGTGISTVSGNGTYDYGQSVTIGATTDSGYSWNGWIVNSGGIATPSTQSASFTMPANAVVLTANGRIDELANDSSTWTEWVPEGDVLVKRTYKVASDGMVLEITPDRSNPAISTEVDSVMRSGYGFSAEQKTGWKNEEGYDEADDAAVTGFQTVSGHFPEFRTQTDIYAVGRNKVRWMEDSDKDGIFELPVNTEDADGENERLHFTPVWFPDMNYIMWTQAYDCWTPAGMISAASQSNPIEIIGSLFDDWYIGRRGN